MNFLSDNVAGASPRVLQALIDANSGAALSYGADPWTQRAERLVRDLFERDDAAVLFVATGTAANALALACLCPPWGAVVCHAESHVNVDECGAPEAFTGGAKLIGLSGRACKLSPEDVAVAARATRGVHSVQPKAISLSQATEAGAVYRPDEIRALADAAHAHGLKVHMDGARFANALVATGASPAALSWRAGVDALSLGLTKGGALAAEAVVLFDPAAAEDLAFRRKRQGHLVSKGRLLGAQAVAMLSDDHWLDLSRHANAMAQRLAEGMAGRVRLAAPVEANELFPVLPHGLRDHLRKAGAAFYDWPSAQAAADCALHEGESVARFVASWATERDDVDRFLAVLHEAAAPAG